MWEGLTNCGQYFPWPGGLVLGHMRRQAKHAMRIKPASKSVLPWLLLQFLPWAPVLTSLGDRLWTWGWMLKKNPFFHKLLLTVAFIKEIESELVQEGISPNFHKRYGCMVTWHETVASSLGFLHEHTWRECPTLQYAMRRHCVPPYRLFFLSM